MTATNSQKRLIEYSRILSKFQARYLSEFYFVMLYKPSEYGVSAKG
jgi:hypothetical protein